MSAGQTRIATKGTVGTPAYDELLATGEALRRRLAESGSSVEAMATLVDEIRVWQRRCAWVVVARTPRAVAEFHADIGSFQRPMKAWSPTSDWQRRLDDALATWLRALDRVRRTPRGVEGAGAASEATRNKWARTSESGRSGMILRWAADLWSDPIALVSRLLWPSCRT